MAVLGLLRCFRVIPGMFPVVGILCGPVPFIFLAGSMTKEERGGPLLLAAVFGCLVGCVEWGHSRRSLPGRGDEKEPQS